MPNGEIVKTVIERRRFVKNRVLLKFKGCDTMDAARDLVGGSLVIDESERMDLDPDEFYEDELIGLEAFTREGVDVGRVKAVMQTGAAPVLVVENEAGLETLIPFTTAICTEVDLSRKRITVDPPEGLLEVNSAGKKRR